MKTVVKVRSSDLPYRFVRGATALSQVCVLVVAQLSETSVECMHPVFLQDSTHKAEPSRVDSKLEGDVLCLFSNDHG